MEVVRDESSPQDSFQPCFRWGLGWPPRTALGCRCHEGAFSATGGGVGVGLVYLPEERTEGKSRWEQPQPLSPPVPWVCGPGGPAAGGGRTAGAELPVTFQCPREVSTPRGLQSWNPPALFLPPHLSVFLPLPSPTPFLLLHFRVFNLYISLYLYTLLATLVQSHVVFIHT